MRVHYTMLGHGKQMLWFVYMPHQAYAVVPTSNPVERKTVHRDDGYRLILAILRLPVATQHKNTLAVYTATAVLLSDGNAK